MIEAVPKREKKEKKPKKIIRTAAGETWEDPSLEEWEKGNGNTSFINLFIYLL